jgi:hypothetical protein
VSALAVVEELERRDEQAAGALATVEELQARTAGLRERAEALKRFFAELPATRERRAAAVSEAAQELRRAEAARREAEAELERAERKRRERERLLAARHAEDARATERVAYAELERMRVALGQLEREATLAQGRSVALDREATQVASQVAQLHRISADASSAPAPGIDGVVEWAARVRPALLLLQSSTVVEREAIIREANELGSAVLGEALGATSVAGVHERVRRALAETPA